MKSPKLPLPGFHLQIRLVRNQYLQLTRLAFGILPPRTFSNGRSLGGYKIDSIIDLISKNEKEQNVDLSRENGDNNDPVDWSEVKSLVEAFAVHIHIKNPIIDIKRIRDAAQIATNSSQLDGYYSILVSSARLDINNFF
jgi:hypothetical protein